MDKMTQKYVDSFMSELIAKNPGEKEFHQAVREVLDSVAPYITSYPHLLDLKIMERIVEPERIIIFRVPWMDDKGEIHVNRGFRVQMNSALGPYKGGIRFHSSVNLSIMKFLAFEQTFKNSLTTLPMGGAKGGSDFSPRGKSDAEVMRFCQSFMTELQRHIGKDTDVPAGDIGVGGREIGYFFGQFKRLNNEFSGVLTGKGLAWGGSLLRPEATGYGACYFAQAMLATRGKSFEGQTVTVSGSGNVAQHAAEKAMRLGAKVVSLSDSNGTIYDPEGFTEEKIAFVKQLKNVRRERIKEYIKQYPGAKYFENERPWSIKCDIAMPCATQNELDENDAKKLLANGCYCVVEGANMPTTPEAIALFQGAKILYSPGKASNAGGVATSGLEMTQNSIRQHWTSEEVDQHLHRIMSDTHDACLKYGTEEDGYINYVKGANVAGFIKVANAMVDQGLV